MALAVEKFGGTSVAGAPQIRSVAKHVAHRRRHGDDLALVVSAMGSETDDLLRLASDVADDPPARELDMLITGGERKPARWWPCDQRPRSPAASSRAARPDS